jgi:peroxiredoxin Q/BCP
MTDLKEGDLAPDFSLPGDDNQTISLSDYTGKKLVLYFYPKDDTPGCTKEACEFQEALPGFNNKKIEVIGVSKDSVKKHDKFKEKYNLRFPLISDEETELCQKFGVWVEKSMYGRTYMGIERATFLIDEKGVVRHIWRKVKVKGHVEDVLKTALELEKAA